MELRSSLRCSAQRARMPCWSLISVAPSLDLTGWKEWRVGPNTALIASKNWCESLASARSWICLDLSIYQSFSIRRNSLCVLDLSSFHLLWREAEEGLRILAACASFLSRKSYWMATLLSSNQSWCLRWVNLRDSEDASSKQLENACQLSVRVVRFETVERSISGIQDSFCWMAIWSSAWVSGELQARTFSLFFGLRLWTGGLICSRTEVRTILWSDQHSAPRMARVKRTSCLSRRRTRM